MSEAAREEEAARALDHAVSALADALRATGDAIFGIHPNAIEIVNQALKDEGISYKLASTSTSTIDRAALVTALKQRATQYARTHVYDGAAAETALRKVAFEIEDGKLP